MASNVPLEAWQRLRRISDTGVMPGRKSIAAQRVCCHLSFHGPGPWSKKYRAGLGDSSPLIFPVPPDSEVEVIRITDLLGSNTFLALLNEVADGAYPKLWWIDIMARWSGDLDFEPLWRVLRSPHVQLKVFRLRQPLDSAAQAERALRALEVNRTLLVWDCPWPGKSMAARADQLLDRNWQLMGLGLQKLIVASAGKLLLCGEGRVGKTTLRRALWQAVNGDEQKMLPGATRRNKAQQGGLLCGLGSKLLSCLRPEGSHNLLSISADQEAGSTTSVAVPIKQDEGAVQVGGDQLGGRTIGGLSTLGPWQPPTRGWEVERVKWDGYTMMLVDCAGQEEYEVLHSFILPEVASQATVFALVCDGRETLLAEAERRLLYWLRYLASTSRLVRSVKVIVNEREGYPCKDWWGRLLRQVAVTFEERVQFLGGTDPFFLDAKKPSEVRASNLRQELQSHLATLLKAAPQVPELVNHVLAVLTKEAQRKKSLSIATWQEVEALFPTVAQDLLKSALVYLHEIGEVVYIQRPDRPTSDQLVILDSEWFGRKVAGELLFPERLWSDKDPDQRKKDGFAVNGQLKLKEIAACWADVLKHTAFSAETLMDVLVDLELCYWLDDDKEAVLVPPFLPTSSRVERAWVESPGLDIGQVVGRQLRCKAASDGASASTSAARDPSGGGASHTLTLLPASILYLLQVQWHAKYGTAGCYEFRVAQRVVSFVTDGVHVLVRHGDFNGSLSIQILGRAVAHERSEDDALDIVAELGDNVISVCAQRLPGVNLLEEAVFPPAAAEDVLAATSCIEMDDVKREVARKPDVMLGRGTLAAKLLTRQELGSILTRLQKAHQSSLKLAEMVLGPILEPDQGSSAGTGLTTAVTVQTGPPSELRRLSMKIDRLGDRLASLLTQHHAAVMAEFHILRTGQEALLDSLRSLQKFVETKDYLPRFVQLEPLRNGILRRKLALHVLCEGEIVPHRVARKESGKEVTVTKEWVREMAPWLKISLKLLVIFAKIGVNIAAPGAGTVIPGVEALHGVFEGTPLDAVMRGYNAQEIVNLVDSNIDSVVAFVEGPQDKVSVEADSGTTEQGRVWELLAAVGVNRDNIPGQFGLHAVRFTKDYKPNNQAGQLAWVCVECRKRLAGHVQPL